MPFDPEDLLRKRKIETFQGVNDSAIAPTASKGGNGSHLIQEFNQLVDNIVYVSYDILPYLHTRWHDDNIAEIGTPLTTFEDPNQFYGVITKAETGNLYDSFRIYAVLAAGVYKLKILGQKDVDAGILSVSLNEAELFNDLDFYGPFSPNFVLEREFTLTTYGLFNFFFSVMAKNSASSGYSIPITKISFIRLY